MKDPFSKLDNGDLQSELQGFIRILTKHLEEGEPLFKVEVNFKGLNPNSLEIFKKLSELELSLKQVLNRFTNSQEATSDVPSERSSRKVIHEDKEEIKIPELSLAQSNFVQVWRSYAQQNEKSLEDIIKESFSNVAIERISLSVKDDRWRLIAIYPQSQRNGVTEGIILPRKWENWFFELYNKWFDCDGEGRRKGIISDVIRPAKGRRISGTWEPIQKGQLVVKGPKH